MKLTKMINLLFLVGCVVMLSASQAFCAATGFEDEVGGPMGLAIQGNAPGEKLVGVLFLELYNDHLVYDEELGQDVDGADGYAVVRLRKSNVLHTFYAEIFDVSTLDPGMAQDAIMAALDEDIKEVFFDGDPDVKLVLRNAEEWGSVVGDRVESLDGCTSFVEFDYTVVDVVIAGK